MIATDPGSLVAITAFVAVGSFAAPTMAAHLDTDNVLDTRTPWLTNQSEVIPGTGVFTDVARTFRNYSGISINDHGDVLVGGSFERNRPAGFEDRPGFAMYSIQGEHDGAPNFWLMANSAGGLHTTSPVDGKTVYFSPAANVNLRGMYVSTGVDLPPAIGVASSRRLEAYTGLDSASPNYTALAVTRFAAPAAPIDFAPGVPNVDATTTNVLSPYADYPMLYTNLDGDKVYFVAHGSDTSGTHNAVYRANLGGSTPSVERLIGHGDADGFTGGSFTPAFINDHDFYGYGNINLLVARNPTNNTTFDLARTGATVPGMTGFTFDSVSASDAQDAGAAGQLVYQSTIRDTIAATTHSAVLLANALTGDRKVLTYAGAPITAITNGVVHSPGSARLAADNDVVMLGNIRQGSVTGAYLFRGLLRYDSQTDEVVPYLNRTSAIAGTGFSLTNIDSFGTHVSGYTVVIAPVTNGVLSGSALLIVDAEGNITPVILPGDTVSFANGDPLVVSYIESFSLGRVGIDGMRPASQGPADHGIAINDAGQMVVILRSGSSITDPGGVFTIQLPIPEPATLGLLLPAALLSLRRRRA